MKNALLVPTDFSDNAWVATQYAVHLAMKFGWDIHLLHVYQTLRRGLAGTQFNEEVEAHASNRANENMELLEQRVKSISDTLSVTSACIEGDLCHIVLEIVEEGNTKFVVMGTKGASGFKHAALGSNTYEIIQKSPIGVLAVPDVYGQFRLDKVGLLTNFKDSEIQLLNAFSNRATTGLDVVMLHIEEANKRQEDESVQYWIDYVLRNTQMRSVSYRSSETIKRLDVRESIPEGIAELIQEERVDLLLVSYNRKSFFKQLFSKSLTKAIAHNLVVPAYFKHTYDEKV